MYTKAFTTNYIYLAYLYHKYMNVIIFCHNISWYMYILMIFLKFYRNFIFLQFGADAAVCFEQATVCYGLHRLLHLFWNQRFSGSGRSESNHAFSFLKIKQREIS